MEVNIGNSPAEGEDNNSSGGPESDTAKGGCWPAEEDDGTEDDDLQEGLQRLLADPSEVIGDLADAAQEGAGEAPPPDPKGVDEDVAPELPVDAAEPEEPSWTPVVFDNWAADPAHANDEDEEAVATPEVPTPELDPLGCADESDDTEPPDEEEDEEQTSSSTSSEAEDYDVIEALPDPSLAAEGQPETGEREPQVASDPALTAAELPAEPLPTASVEEHGIRQQQPQQQQQQQQHLLPPALQHPLINGAQQQPLVQPQLSDEGEQCDLPADVGPETASAQDCQLEQLALPVDVGPDPALAGASSRAARRKAAAALPAELTPRLLCLRDLASASVEELGVTYTEFIEQLHGRAIAGRPLVPRNRVSFQVKDSLTSKTFGKVSVPVTLKRPRPLPRTPPLPDSGAPAAPAQVVVLDDTEDAAPASAVAAEDDAPQSEPEHEEEPDPTDPYENPTAPLALLRAYSMQGRWTGIRNGFVVFEDDRVQYPTATLTPVREQEDGGALLSLASLWLLAAMRGRYKDAASHKILQDHGAVRIAARHVPHLLQFLVGSSKECRLLVTPEKLASIPAPVAMRLAPLRKRSSARPPLPAADLRHLPERERDEVTAQRLVETMRSTAQLQLAIRQVEVEEAALSGLLRDLQARLESTDAEVAGARRRRRECHEEFREELQITRSYASNKRRKGTNGDATKSGTMVEDPVARFLESLDVASAQPAAKPLAPVE